MTSTHNVQAGGAMVVEFKGQRLTRVLAIHKGKCEGCALTTNYSGDCPRDSSEELWCEQLDDPTSYIFIPDGEQGFAEYIAARLK